MVRITAPEAIPIIPLEISSISSSDNFLIATANISNETAIVANVTAFMSFVKALTDLPKLSSNSPALPITSESELKVSVIPPNHELIISANMFLPDILSTIFLIPKKAANAATRSPTAKALIKVSMVGLSFSEKALNFSEIAVKIPPSIDPAFDAVSPNPTIFSTR